MHFALKPWLRRLARQPLTTGINLAGLSIAIASCLILWMWGLHQLSYDNYHPDLERIYRIGTRYTYNTGSSTNGGVSLPMYKAIRSEVTGVAVASHMMRRWGADIKVGDRLIEFGHEQNMYMALADSQITKILHYDVVAGNLREALTQPGKMALSKRAIAMLYPELGENYEKALGKGFTVSNAGDFTVVAVLENPRRNTDNPADMLGSILQFKTFMGWDMDTWNSTSGNSHCFIKLTPGTTPSSIEPQLNRIVEKAVPARKGVNETVRTYHVFPLSEQHFRSDFGLMNGGSTNKTMIYAVFLLGGMILFSAAINFINISIAQSTRRAREVGVNKALGALRSQLLRKFVTETGLLILVAATLALAFVELALPTFNTLMQAHLSLTDLGQPQVLMALLGMLLFLLLSAGLYPAAVLSSFTPTAVLKGAVEKINVGGIGLRKVLLMGQFAISLAFILGAWVLNRQVDYMVNKPLGWNRDGVASMYTRKSLNKKEELAAWHAIMATAPGVTAYSFCDGPPTSGDYNTSDVAYQAAGREIVLQPDIKVIDSTYLRLYQIPLLAGTTAVYRDSIADAGVVVNETLVGLLGIKNPADAVGKPLRMWGRRVYIAGVVADFHTRSLHNKMPATLMMNIPNGNRHNVSFVVNRATAQETFAHLEKAYKQRYPDNIFEYTYVDERVQKMYEDEQHLSQLFTAFAGIAMGIVCMGLFGLVNVMAVRKMKEIGIRKVLGASDGHVFGVFAKEFVWVMLLAFFIAGPITLVLLGRWLEDFAYRIEVGPWHLLFACGILIAVSALTIGQQAWRSTRINPTTALRSE